MKKHEYWDMSEEDGILYDQVNNQVDNLFNKNTQIKLDSMHWNELFRKAAEREFLNTEEGKKAAKESNGSLIVLCIVIGTIYLMFSSGILFLIIVPILLFLSAIFGRSVEK